MVTGVALTALGFCERTVRVSALTGCLRTVRRGAVGTGGTDIGGVSVMVGDTVTAVLLRVDDLIGPATIADTVRSPELRRRAGDEEAFSSSPWSSFIARVADLLAVLRVEHHLGGGEVPAVSGDPIGAGLKGV